ncbi:O-acetylhomoserine aminocarboxypropyltransferase/cysteine synthase family protein [Oceanithermus sp.]
MPEYRFETLALHAGYQPAPGEPRQVPVAQSSSFVFASAEQAARLFALEETGHVYSRISNPTVAVFEERMAALEGGLAAVASASGHAAQFLAITALAGAGDNLVSSPGLYGGTLNQFRVALARLGIEARFTSPQARPEEFLRLSDGRTRLWYLESLSNPALQIPDFDSIAEAAARIGVAVLVDNTFGMGGYLFRPLEHGAAAVLHSATKWIGGHGAALGGLLIDGGFDYGGERYPQLNSPQESYHGLVPARAFSPAVLAGAARAGGLRDFGPALSPHDAFLLLLGVETLALRAERHVQNALELAHWLRSRPEVAWVNYPGLEDHPSYRRAQRYFGGRPGAVLTFGLRGGFRAAERLLPRLRLVSHLANVGDTRTLIIHPASTTHAQLSEEQLRQAGVPPEMLRLSVGIEDVDDLKADLAAALED